MRRGLRERFYRWMSIYTKGLTLVLAVLLLFGCNKAQQPQSFADQTRQIELAKMDVAIKEAQIETAQAKARLDRELAKPVAVQGALSPEGISEQIELLQDATADYTRKRRHLELLIEARAKIDKK